MVSSVVGLFLVVYGKRRGERGIKVIGKGVEGEESVRTVVVGVTAKFSVGVEARVVWRGVGM